jgi:hypothetical protein
MGNCNSPSSTILLNLQYHSHVQRGVAILTGKERVNEGSTVQFSFYRWNMPNAPTTITSSTDNRNRLGAKRLGTMGDRAVMKYLASALSSPQCPPIHVRFVYCNLSSAVIDSLLDALRLNTTLVGFSEFGNPGGDLNKLINTITQTRAPLHIFNNEELSPALLTARAQFATYGIGAFAGTMKPGKLYFAFISYAKTDSLSETRIVHEFVAAKFPGQSLFRDTEQHFSLSELINNVSQSMNVLVFLTPNYPKRPYCLIELHHALKSGANIVTVKIRKSGLAMFDFELMNKALASDDALQAYIDESGWKILVENGISVSDIRSDLKRVMDVKATTLDMDEPTRVQNIQMEVICEGLKTV